LLIWGKEDQTVTIDNAEQVRRGIPQTEFHAIERAGHLPHMERTDVVNPLLIDWLRAH
jgi:pimeloyl-ACP methyl ester carboxylesterase